MKRKIIIVLILATVTVGLIAPKLGFSAERPTLENPNYEAIAKVEKILDGDTLKVKVTNILDPHRGVSLGEEKVRLAGVDTDEKQQDDAAKKYENVKNLNQEQYEETIYYQSAIMAKNYLKNNLPEDTQIYLDIDDLADGQGPYRGYYGRLIALVYVRKSGKWINVNGRLLDNIRSFGNEVVNSPILTKFSSEFDPYYWLCENYPYK